MITLVFRIWNFIFGTQIYTNWRNLNILIWILELTTKLIGKGEKASVLSKVDFSVMAEISQKEGIN